MSNTPRTDAEEPLASNEALHVAYWEERGRRQRISEAYVILEHQNAELLDALDSLATACELPGDHCETEQALRIAKAAITKAKGGMS